jgi:HK97 family phage major capsid protein
MTAPPEHTFESLLGLIYAQTPYVRCRSVFRCDPVTAYHVRQIKDDDGRFAWEDGLAVGMRDRLLGYPVWIDEAYDGLTFGLGDSDLRTMDPQVTLDVPEPKGSQHAHPGT